MYNISLNNIMYIFFFDNSRFSKEIMFVQNICCEQILQHIAFSSCTSSPAAEGEDGKVGEESTPWTALASVALFKLFNDWQVLDLKQRCGSR